jgi:hypothetical protein
MKKLFSDSELEEARSSESPIKTSRAVIDRPISGVKKYVIFKYADTQ